MTVSGWTLFSVLRMLLQFATTTLGTSELSLDPNPPQACDFLRVQWPGNNQTSPVNVSIIEVQGRGAAGQTLFEARINPPTLSVEWLVSAMHRASLEISILTGGDLNAPPYQATDAIVRPGSCFDSVRYIQPLPVQL